LTKGITTGFQLTQKAGAILCKSDITWTAFCAADPEHYQDSGISWCYYKNIFNALEREVRH